MPGYSLVYFKNDFFLKFVRIERQNLIKNGIQINNHALLQLYIIDNTANGNVGSSIPLVDMHFCDLVFI